MSKAAYEQAIVSFWDWWVSGGADRVAGMLESERSGLDAEVAPHVAAIDPGLQWEISPGPTGRPLMVVTAGDPGLRAPARAWLHAAPARDATWAYTDLRQPLADAAETVLDVAGRRVELGAFVVAAHRGTPRSTSPSSTRCSWTSASRIPPN